MELGSRTIDLDVSWWGNGSGCDHEGQGEYRHRGQETHDHRQVVEG